MKKKDDGQQMALDGTAEDEILSRLGERVEKAIGTIQQLRRERDELQRRLAEVEQQIQSREEEAVSRSSLQEENDRFRKERGEIRVRIETILDALERLDGPFGDGSD